MKTRALLFGGILSLAAAPALAGLGPYMGLPRNWSFTDTTYGYDAGPYNGNPMSTMCVGCHSVNPSQFIGSAQISNLGAVPVATLVASRGTHFVTNLLGTPSTVTSVYGATLVTNTDGGGWTGAFADPNTGKYEKVTAWTTTGDARSKYGSTTGTSILTAGEMICESCHTISQGTPVGANLLAEYVDNGDSNLCEGCHSDMHGAGNLRNFYADARKRHHVMNNTGGLGTYTDYTDILAAANYTAKTMWAPDASTAVSATWCTTPYVSATVAAPIISTVGAAISFRNQCNAAGQGARAVADVTGDIVPSAGGSQLSCSNCHRPHNAATGAGAFILRLGNDVGTDFAGKPGTSRATAATPVGFGIRRQKDVGDSDLKLYGEYNTLCNACHRGYGT